MFELAAAFGAFADHCGHCAFYRVGFADRAIRFGHVVQPSVDKQQAFGDGLFRGSEQTFVEPDGVGGGNFVQTAGDLS